MRLGALIRESALTLAVGLLLAGSATAATSVESPTEVVRGTVNEVIRILDDPKMKDPSQLQPRRTLLEQVIGARFDYEEMSKRSLAAHWNQLNDAEQADFVKLFKTFLSDRYADKVEGYSGEKTEYLKERIDGSYAEVRTKLVSSKMEVPLDYRLIVKGGKWYAYDLIVDGVSLIKNYRSQFANIIRSDSYQELVRKLRDRTLREDKKKAD
jgi:phospholipid transport system substrate-binding protein